MRIDSETFGGDIVLAAGSSNPALAKDIAAALGGLAVAFPCRRFNDGEVQVRFETNLRGKRLFLIQSTCPPVNDHLMELLLMIDAAKRASAGDITAIIPYYGYARQDRKAAPRTPISARLVADLLSVAGATRMVSMDLHATQIQGFFDIPVDNLYAATVMKEYISDYFNLGEVNPGIVFVSPDMGGAERTRAYSRILHCPMAIIDKRRPRPGVAEVMNVVGEVAGSRCILLDDMVDSAGTLVTAAEALVAKGAVEVYALCAHAVLSGNAAERIETSPIRRLFVSDSIPLRPGTEAACGKIRVIPSGRLFAEAIVRIASDSSVSELFNIQ